ncbi:hypothetical protein NLI96_g7116 [Meripilus lineatus]|uniref:Uncharacterized protein n=1 Tax=Meripilus lineatus TaxID=2056292 RepID=A0AAD5V1I8_9APHY|nr:hypothetical protein NLI96_g7116 [Physisporinus lineatus]
MMHPPVVSETATMCQSFISFQAGAAFNTRPPAPSEVFRDHAFDPETTLGPIASSRVLARLQDPTPTVSSVLPEVHEPSLRFIGMDLFSSSEISLPYHWVPTHEIAHHAVVPAILPKPSNDGEGLLDVWLSIVVSVVSMKESRDDGTLNPPF